MHKKNIIFLTAFIFSNAALFPSGLSGIANKAAKKEREEVVPLLAASADARIDITRLEKSVATIQIAASLAQTQHHNAASKPRANTISECLNDIFKAGLHVQHPHDATKQKAGISLIASTVLGFVHGYVFHKRVEVGDRASITFLQFAQENNDLLLGTKKETLLTFQSDTCEHPGHKIYMEQCTCSNKLQRYALDGTSVVPTTLTSNEGPYYDQRFFRGFCSTKKTFGSLLCHDGRITLDMQSDGSERSILLHEGELGSFIITPDDIYCIYSLSQYTSRSCHRIIVTHLPLASSQIIEMQERTDKLAVSKTNHEQELLLAVVDEFANAQVYKITKNSHAIVDKFCHPLGSIDSHGYRISSSLAISQKRQLAFMGLDDGCIVRRCLIKKTSLVSHPLSRQRLDYCLPRIQFFNNESMIAATDREKIRIFNVDSFVPLQEIDTANQICHFDISADDSMIAVTSGKHCVSIYCLGQDQDQEKERENQTHQARDKRTSEAHPVVHRLTSRPGRNFPHTVHTPNRRYPCDEQMLREEQANSRCDCVIL